MNILILSDLHIDMSDNFGTFQWDEMEFILQIEIMRAKYNLEKVIFNGDVLELLKYRYEDITAANPILMRYFGDKDFIFIKGNHDIINKYGLDNYTIINSSGQKIYIEHGHNADWLNGTRIGRALSRMGFSILKKLTKSKLWMDIYFRVVAFNEQIHKIPKRYNTLKYLTYALRLLKENDMVILGHTHKLESHHTYYLTRKKRYLNSGSCSLGRFQGIVLDTETLKYEMIKETKESMIRSRELNHAV
ncbi:MAG TPA: metallophosphoesterase [Bacteroidales bacterium]|nr:metallophosphoesterase [Bacteroidales bacterium]